MSGIKLVGIGACVPKRRMTNADFTKIIDTTDEWIVSHTGIEERRYCETETHSDLCIEAAKKALEHAKVSPEEISVCIVATVSAEHLTPSASCLVQSALGLSANTVCLDINAACTGFISALHTAQCLLAASEKSYALVIGAEVLSRFINYEDRGTCILFGDGAGAAVVEFGEDYPSISAQLGSRGDADILQIAGVGKNEPNYLTMKGTAVFKFAVETVPKCMDEVLEKAKLTTDDIDIFAFHQANARIIDTVVKRRELPAERCFKNIQKYGNTSAASIPLLLSELYEDGSLKDGARMLLLGFGGGLTWGGAVMSFGERRGKTI